MNPRTERGASHHPFEEKSMKFLNRTLVALALAVGAMTTLPAMAGSTDPLFVNPTTDNAHRANMGIGFGGNQLQRGHPLTIFLNDRGVLIGSKANADRFAEQQKALTDLVGKGATVLICSMCMKHHGVKEADLLPGVKVGSPEVTGSALFKENTQALTW
jgi:sulfur relay (sulfurtransferase) complex TusBCD TusD component (DsrE family)